jgi:RNA polymerase sigma-70 factor (ECF subfamily)
MTVPDEPEVRMTQDADADFRDFVVARSPALLRTAYLLAGGDWALAEDLLQTALTKTYLAWRRIKDQNARESYVRTTLATTATSWWRRRWHGERATAVLPESATAATGHQFEERDALWRLVLKLPVRQRAVLVLRFYEDLSETQIAHTLGLSPGTVKSHTSRALATLRAEFASQGAQ